MRWDRNEPFHARDLGRPILDKSSVAGILRFGHVRPLLQSVRRNGRLQLVRPGVAQGKLLAAGFADMSRDENCGVRNFEKFRPDTVLDAKRDNVPVRVIGIVFLDMSP